MEANYARLLPGDLFGQIEKQSLAITPIVIHQQETGKKAKNTRTALSSTAGKKPVAPVAVKEVKVRQQAATIAAQPKAAPTVAAPAVQAVKTPYHIIIASVGSEKTPTPWRSSWLPKVMQELKRLSVTAKCASAFSPVPRRKRHTAL